VIGASLRFPGGVNSLLTLKKFLSSRSDAISARPPFLRGWTPHQGVGAFLLHDPQLIDHKFFGMSQRESRSGDPQQHLLLELASEVVESSGIFSCTEDETVGVFVGVSDFGRGSQSYDPLFQYSSHVGVVAGKIANLFGFSGPALTLDTETSSSLVSIHQALQSLKLGESTIAVAGGVSVLQSASMSRFYAKAHILSKSGKCLPFDQRSDGVVRKYFSFPLFSGL
jgi:acyl transferase domain-containing protein